MLWTAEKHTQKSTLFCTFYLIFTLLGILMPTFEAKLKLLKLVCRVALVNN